jgi:hypothetical protein
MPKFSAGSVPDFDLCECNWKDCAAIQENVALHCVKIEEKDVALEFVKITAAEPNNFTSVRCQQKGGKQDSNCFVARHRCWSRQVLGHNGIDNRTLVLECQKTELPKILGQDGKVKQLNARLPENLAKALGHKEDSE